MCEPNGYVSGYKSSDPLVGFQLEEIINPIRVVHVLQSLIPERVVRVDELLERVGEVILIGEVPEFIAEHCIKTLQILTVLITLLLSQAEVLHLEHLEDLAVKDLTNQRSLGHRNKVTVDLHLHDTIHCLNLHLLTKPNVTFLKLVFLGSLAIFLQEV